MPKRKKRKTVRRPKGSGIVKSPLTKRLQTELQSLIAYAVYDSKAVLQGGVSGTKSMITNRLYDAYMPSDLVDDDRISGVEMFLQGSNRFKYLFEALEDSDNEIGSDPYTNRAPAKLVIPESMHCITGAEIVVGRGCITKSLLTRKNLSNMADIKADTLFRNAKGVEANCKKALAICVSKDSPYRGFDGTFPSGTNRDDYLLWIRKKMYLLEKSVKVTILDDDDDAESNDVECDDAGSDGAASVCSNSEEYDEEMPSDTYFKGFFAFALWGYIPPPGGETFKSSLMATVIDKDVKAKKEDGRAEVKKEKLKNELLTQSLEARGTPRVIEAEGIRFKTITDIMVKGRQELNKQKLFKLSINKIEFELRYAGERIGEIKEEIKELKEMMEDGSDDDDIDNTKDELKTLRIKLKKTRERKKQLFDEWKNTTSSETCRRTLLDNQQDDIENKSLSTSLSAVESSIVSQSILSPITTSDKETASASFHTISSPVTLADDCVPANLNFRDAATSNQPTPGTCSYLDHCLKLPVNLKQCSLCTNMLHHCCQIAYVENNDLEEDAMGHYCMECVGKSDKTGNKDYVDY